MADGDDGPGIVCRVMPDGEIVCERVEACPAPTAAMMRVATSSDGLSQKVDDQFINALPDGEWGPNKIALARRLLEIIGESNLPDDKVTRRSGECVDAVRQLLTPIPPSILLFNYSTQPANVMGAYYLNKADVVRMQEIFQIFQHPKEP